LKILTGVAGNEEAMERRGERAKRRKLRKRNPDRSVRGESRKQ